MTSNSVQLSNGWELNRILGVGGFGTVQLWIHTQSGQKLGKP